MEKTHDVTHKDGSRDHFYRFQCSCYTPQHCMDVEIEDEQGHRSVVLYFYENNHPSFVEKVKAIWKYIFIGERMMLNDFHLVEADNIELGNLLTKPTE